MLQHQEPKETFDPEQAGRFIHDTLDSAKKSGNGEPEYQQMMLDYALHKAREEDRPLHEVYREARNRVQSPLRQSLSSRAKRVLVAVSLLLCGCFVLLGSKGGSHISFGIVLISIVAIATVFGVGALYSRVCSRKPR